MLSLRRSVILLIFICIYGCGKGNEGAVTLDVSGKHPAGWIVASNGGNHPAQFLSAPDKCKGCHGTDLMGGISKVSCSSTDRNGLSCHAQGPYAHASGWFEAAAHGSHAKAAVAGANGMAFCTNCHGADYRGAGSVQKDCLKCHTTAPHPVTPWASHATTNASNAPACAQCHTGRANLISPVIASPSGTGGCFNNTLCHGVKGHDFPFPGSLHMIDASNNMQFSCVPCHELSNIAIDGVYPAVPTGTAPMCSGCHSGWNTGNGFGTGCAACHGGAAGNGRPTGTIFPNRIGEHGTHDAIMANCDYCHFGGGTGMSVHGNSGRVVKTVKDVKIAKNPARFTGADTITFIQNISTGVVTCNGSCHIGNNTVNHADTW